MTYFLDLLRAYVLPLGAVLAAFVVVWTFLALFDLLERLARRTSWAKIAIVLIIVVVSFIAGYFVQKFFHWNTFVSFTVPMAILGGIYLCALTVNVNVVDRWQRRQVTMPTPVLATFETVSVTARDVHLWDTPTRNNSVANFTSGQQYRIRRLGPIQGDFINVEIEGLGSGWVNNTYLEEAN